MLWTGWECDHAMAVVRKSDGSVKLEVIAGAEHPDNSDPLAILEKRVAAYEKAITESRRFLGIARAALGEPHLEKGWTCPSCGRAFYDPQPVCAACGAEATADD